MRNFSLVRERRPTHLDASNRRTPRIPESSVRLPRRLLLALVAAPLAGCAGAAAPTSEPVATQRTIASGGAGFGTITTNPSETAVRYAAAVDREHAMRALVAAYQKLGIDATLVDPPAGRIGNPRFDVRGTLNGKAISAYLSCGETLTANRANTARVSISLVSVVTAEAARSVIATRLESVAVDRAEGNSSDIQPCHTTGVLERDLHNAVGLTLAGR